MARADAVAIRPATADDAEAIEDNHHRCFLDAYAGQLARGEITVPDRAGTLRQIAGWLHPDSGFETRVAAVDDAPIGHVTVCGPVLVHLFVVPEHQGVGIGRRLLADGEAMMAADGHREIELHVRVDNPVAIAFYGRRGWTTTGRVIHTSSTASATTSTSSPRALADGSHPPRAEWPRSAS